MSAKSKAEVGQLLNLDFFVGAFLGEAPPRPADERLHNAFAIMRDAELFEAIAWLILGIQLGFFPSEAVSGYRDWQGSRLSPSSKEIWPLIESMFPQHSWVARALRSQSLPGTMSHVMGEPKDAGSPQLGVFKSALLLGADMAKDVAMRALTVALDFAPDGYWNDDIIEPSIDPDQVAFAAEETWVSSYGLELVCAGLLRSTAYMDRYRSIFAEIGEMTADPSIPDLRQSVNAIIGWRLNAGEGRQRIVELTGKVSDEIDRYMVESRPDKPFGMGYFKKNVSRLIRYWNGESEPLTAGAY